MDKESLKRLMGYIDDPNIKDTMERVSDNLDRVDRVRDQREHPADKKIRARNILDCLDENMKSKLMPASSGIALVLTGGGAKASYQVGVVKALWELEIKSRITGLSGTSAGALNAALLSGGNVSIAEGLWTSIDESRMNGKEGFFSPSEENDAYLEELIRLSGVIEGINRESLLTVVTAFDYQSGYPRDFVLNMMSEEDKIKCLLASSAFPVAFKEREIAGKRYIDGGIPVFGSNMPVAPLYHLGFRRFIVVHCSSTEEAGEWSFLGKWNLKANQELYFNGASFVHIYPGKNLGGILEGTANFNHDYILNNMKLGYEDMQKTRGDLDVFSEKVEDLDEVHVLNGNRYRSFAEILDQL